MFRHDVPYNGENQRTSDTTERAGQGTGHYEQMIGLGESAKKRSQSESGIEGQKSTLSVKAVEKKTGGDPRDTRAQSVGRNDDAKLCRRNREDPHVLRPERHDDDEINNRSEIDRRQ